MSLAVLEIDDLKAMFSNVAEELSFQQTFPEVMTLDQVARFLQMTKPTVYDRIDKGLPVCRKFGDPRFVKSDVLEWLRKNG